MAAPVLKCLWRKERVKDGIFCFKEWVDTPSFIYIGQNIGKYLNDFNKKDSIWCNPFSTFDLSREEKNNYYKAFVRCNPNVIDKLTELENKVIGCRCTDNCH